MITLDFLINAVSLGSTYALLALGMVIVYGILKLVNFAYGELIMIAGTRCSCSPSGRTCPGSSWPCWPSGWRCSPAT
jgi:branched-subunit amino acid ABC-type transport system permease component